MRKNCFRLFPLALAVTAVTAPVHAFESGDVLLKLGVHAVDPKSNNGTLADGAFEADVDSSWRPSIQAEYFLSAKVGVELLAAVPFSHDVELNGAEAVSFKHLPPTLSLQYHFGNDRLRPFLGAGINYVLTYDAESKGPLAGTRVGVGNSWGIAFHGGIDYQLDKGWFIGADLRWIDVDADVSVDGADVGSVSVDPLVYGAYFGWKF